jgi:hypothetical protein
VETLTAVVHTSVKFAEDGTRTLELGIQHGIERVIFTATSNQAVMALDAIFPKLELLKEWETTPERIETQIGHNSTVSVLLSQSQEIEFSTKDLARLIGLLKRQIPGFGFVERDFDEELLRLLNAENNETLLRILEYIPGNQIMMSREIVERVRHLANKHPSSQVNLGAHNLKHFLLPDSEHPIDTFQSGNRTLRALRRQRTRDETSKRSSASAARCIYPAPLSLAHRFHNCVSYADESKRTKSEKYLIYN